MPDPFSMFSSPGFMPHGHCYLWQPPLLWTYVLSDGLIGLSYYSIPVALVYFMKRRPDVHFSWIVQLFSLFIFACGTTHLIAIWTIWHADYWLDAGARAITAGCSAVTAVLLWPLIPRALKIPSTHQMGEALQALRASQGFLQRTGVLAGVGGWEADLESGKVTLSEHTYHLLDLAPGQPLHMEQIVEFFLPEAQPALREAIDAAVAHGAPWDLEVPLLSSTGRPFWARVLGSVEREGGVSKRLVGAFQDVTSRKQMESDLAQSRELMRVTLDSIGDAVVTVDPQGKVQWLNPVAERLTGFSKAEARGRASTEVLRLVHDDTGETVDQAEIPLFGDLPLSAVQFHTLISREGRHYGVEGSTAPIRSDDGTILGVVRVFHDVSEKRRMSREMKHRATHDPLTGLPNRSEFESRLSALMDDQLHSDMVHAMLYIDLDQFKLVNDTCGHSAGDQLLRQIAGVFKGCVRGRDLVARLGGDEFGILLETCPLEVAQRVAQKICDQTDEFRFLHDGRRFRVGASVGLVPLDDRWPSPAAALYAADTSCYTAKESGRNQVHVWSEQDAKVRDRHGQMQWVARLEKALDDQCFMLYAQRLQPFDRAEQGIACEVLLRLREPDGTITAPGAFLPAAERFHMATRIDRWVLRAVFDWMQAIGEKAQRIGLICINLSAQSIGDRAFHRDVLEMVRRASFDVAKICFELSEVGVVTSLNDTRVFGQQVRDLGLRLAVDDFGQGAYSYSYLKNLPVDYLKIDGRFSAALLTDALDQATVRCFCDVARVLGVKTIAESVEEATTAEVLQALGVDVAQGFLYHRPEPIAELLN